MSDGMSHNFCNEDYGNMDQLSMITAEMGDQLRIIIKLKKEHLTRTQRSCCRGSWVQIWL